MYSFWFVEIIAFSVILMAVFVMPVIMASHKRQEDANANLVKMLNNNKGGFDLNTLNAMMAFMGQQNQNPNMNSNMNQNNMQQMPYQLQNNIPFCPAKKNSTTKYFAIAGVVFAILLIVVL